MKVKDLLWPIVLGVSALVVTIGLFLGFYAIEGFAGYNSFTLFLADEADSGAFMYLVAIGNILGLLALVVLATLSLVKAFGGKIAKGKLIALIAGIVAAVSAVMVVLFTLLFNGANKPMIPGIGFYFTAAGLVIGAVSAFLTSKDLE